ncbi:hypothetical protein G5I_05741 [Acromyrmex echinatior]|uniref:DUF4817 domain-containing protein n=1 Tax=Acromyrmex echinatior TaxID=103372 RepID=F4WJ64_ACREC|nr:hypothetical protein G5I_05741 [Acromyrmex echinatior]
MNDRPGTPTCPIRVGAVDIAVSSRDVTVTKSLPRASHFHSTLGIANAPRIPNMSRGIEINRLTGWLSVIVRGCLRTDTRIAATRRKARETRCGSPWDTVGGVGAPEWSPREENYTRWWAIYWYVFEFRRMATPNELQTRNFDSLLVIPSAARNNMFSLEERFEILKTYFQSQCCVAETVRILKRNMGRDRAPTEGAIRKLVRKVREKGMYHDLWDMAHIDNFEKQYLHLGLPWQAFEMAEAAVPMTLDCLTNKT